MQTLNDDDQERCRTSIGLLKVLSEKLKSHNNETIWSLQHCKLVREQNENAEGRMGCLRIKANECVYKDRRIKEQFIKCINNDDMMMEIRRNDNNQKDK